LSNVNAPLDIFTKFFKYDNLYMLLEIFLVILTTKNLMVLISVINNKLFE